MPITPELLDELLKDYKSPDDMFGDDGLLQQLTKAVVERALQGELTHHLGYERHDPAGANSGNSRNGKSKKTIKGKRGQIEIDVPRDRASSFEPQLIKKVKRALLDSTYTTRVFTRVLSRVNAHLRDYSVESRPT